MAYEPRHYRFPLVANSEPQPTAQELIERLTRLKEERLRLIKDSQRVRDQILRLVEEQKRRARLAWPTPSETPGNT